jgi:hypothetical protein
MNDMTNAEREAAIVAKAREDAIRLSKLTGLAFFEREGNVFIRNPDKLISSLNNPNASIVARTSDIEKVVDYDPEPDASYAVRMAEEENIPEELEAIERGDLVGYYCRAVVTLEILCETEGHSSILQRIESPGLWSIFAESDDDPYFDEIFAEERHTLVCMLRKMGIRVEDDLVLCRYADCPEGHPVGAEDDDVTCPRCREALGLPPLES